MRITFVLPTVSMAGGIRVVGIYARELMDMGHTVCIVSPPPRTLSFRQKFRSWRKGDGWPKKQAELRSHLDGGRFDHHILDVWRPVNDADVPDADVVVATWWETAEWVDALSSRKGAKVYFIQHHEVFSYLPIERCQATYRLPMHKIVIAHWLKQIMETEYDDKVVDLVPNSVDKSQFFAPLRGKQETPTVGLLYSSASFKGVDTSFAALRHVRKKIPSLRIVCFGSEYPRSELPLPVGTEFILSPPQDEIRDIYARCDVWVTASTSEGFNLPAMEAMACRTPVVATRIGWPEEAVKTGWNGVLVEVDDVSRLADGVEWVLSQSEEDWKVLSSNAHATVCSSSWEASAAMFEQALRNACRRAARNEIGGNCAV
ncbi:glycosyltransferase involved in cell wall biosynthesis [Bradyrhizobium sp. AZCC 1719]|uniref:glycosyltransferase family 4 protein n=1 Tax=Bradyrhizobium sp. AZCC 1719 TaxID=3117028 RepID=UPI002FEEA1EF